MYVSAMAEGLSYYRALAERYRDDPRRALEVAAGLVLHGDLARAETVLEAAAARDADPELAHHLGLVRASGGDHESALAAFGEALAADAGRALVRANLGRSLLALGRVDEAIVTLERAVADDPTLPAVHTALALALAERPSAGERVERALLRALALDPRHREAHVLLGRLYLRQRRDADAVRALERARRYHPYDTDLLYNLALAEERRGHGARADAYLRRILEIDPTDNDAQREAL
jgi:tetratricopeptide (TPR) repeat protein